VSLPNRPFRRGDTRDFTRINRRIRVPEVRVIDEDGKQIGVLQTEEAMRLAMDRGLDLVEISAGAKPPVCKIIDYGKFKYQKKKKEHAAKLKQTVILLKEIKFTPNTEEHDYQFNLKHIERFIEDGNNAKVTIKFKGRELSHKELGYNLLTRIKGQLQEIVDIEQDTKMEGRNMTMVLIPKIRRD
jgi:translation initiation factor IF-3